MNGTCWAIITTLACLLSTLPAQGQETSRLISIFPEDSAEGSHVYLSPPLTRASEPVQIHRERLQFKNWRIDWSLLEPSGSEIAVTQQALNETAEPLRLMAHLQYTGPLQLSPAQERAFRPQVLLVPAAGLSQGRYHPSYSWLARSFGYDERPRRFPPGSEEPLNVVIFLIDTLRSDHLPAYGHPFVAAPHSDMLASLGVTFANSYAASPSTRPSVGSIFTGVQPKAHGATRHAIDGAALYENVPRMAEWFLKQEYYTAAVSSNAQISPPYGFGRGFERYLCPVSEYQVTPRGIEALRSLHEPFFLYLHYIAPHAPYDPPAVFGEPYAGLTDYPEQDRHCGEITLDDQRIGRVLAELARQGLLERTLIWLVSDHGEEFWEHGWNGHGAKIYEESVRTASILSLPTRFAGGAIVGVPAMHIDMFPTLQTLLGHSPLEHQQGTSLSPYLEAEPSDLHVLPQERVVYLHHGGGLQDGPHESDKQGVVYNDHKLIHWTQTDQWELYHLSEDPAEQNNLLPEERPLAVEALAKPVAGTITTLRPMLRQHLEECEALAQQFASGGEEGVELSPAELENLRNLGYID